jgi:hypothetical protein
MLLFTPASPVLRLRSFALLCLGKFYRVSKGHVALIDFDVFPLSCLILETKKYYFAFYQLLQEAFTYKTKVPFLTEKHLNDMILDSV